eukprot:1162007-Pelagomonas_calceolata.AAC.3
MHKVHLTLQYASSWCGLAQGEGATREKNKWAEETLPSSEKKRKVYASQVQLRALRKGPLTSKLARASPIIN